MLRVIDIKSLVIGLLLGVCVMLAKGNAAPALPGSQRYQISVSETAGGLRVFVLDHQTNRVTLYKSNPWIRTNDGFQIEDPVEAGK